MSEPILTVTNLVKQFPVRTGLFGQKTFKAAVDNVSFSIERGRTLALVGESGSGKSTVGLMLLGLLETTSGSVVFDGKLWVFGGWAARPTQALNDVWYSSDGVIWQPQAERAPWTPRFPVAIVFKDKIWIYSGKHPGSDDSWGGDLWQMTATAKNPP